MIATQMRIASADAAALRDFAAGRYVTDARKRRLGRLGLIDYNRIGSTMNDNGRAFLARHAQAMRD